MRQNERFLTGLACFVAGFVVFCGVLVFRSGLPPKADSPDNFILLSASGVSETNEPPEGRPSLNSIEKKTDQPKDDSQNQYWAIGGDPEKIFIGAKDPNTEDPQIGFPLQLELDSAGASIRKATFSCGNGKGFNDRNPKGPKPSVLLSPVGTGENNEIMSMANQSLVLVEQNIQLALNTLSWKTLNSRKNDDG